MKSPKLSRRGLLTTGLVATGGVAAAAIAGRSGLVPPDGSGVFGAGATLTYAANRLLVGGSLAREFPRTAISEKPFVNGPPPQDEEFRRHQAAGFADWRLAVEGLVARPASYSLADLRSRPARSHITSWRAKKGGPTSPSGPACRSPTSSKPRDSCRRPASSSISRSSRPGGTASRSTKRGTRRRCWRME